MLIFYFILALIVLLSVRYQKTGFVDNYLSMDTTNVIKGVFIILVFIKHATSYVIQAGWTPEGMWGELFHFVNNNVGQWIVAMFLFYSGYGIMESIKRKGRKYVLQIPRKRFLQVLVNFDIAVVIFILVDILLNKPIDLKQCLLSFTGWESVGNSNWYIFIILIMYLLTYLSFYKKSDEDYKVQLGILLFSTLVLCVLLSYFKAQYWYNTMFCYAAGVFFSVYKEKVENIAKSHYWKILVAGIITLLLIDRIPYSVKGLVYNAFSVVFCSVILLVTMKFKFNSPILLWCGKNLFPLYIYQRISMMVFSCINDGSFADGYPFLFTVACLTVTIMITKGYKYISIKL